MNKDFYDIEQFGITRQGHWLEGNDARKALEQHKDLHHQEKISSETLHSLLKSDIIFPVLHGTCGEDGTIQGLFDVFSKAYVGCDHRSAAICMDKELSKRLAADAGLPVLPFVCFNRYQWEASKEEIVCRINDKLTYPVFVKAVHLGSSIGIHKVSDPSSLSAAIMESFRVDDKLTVENGLENMREIEFSLLGNEDPEVFPPGEVYAEGNLHDYDSKYGLNPAKPAARFDTKAKLPQEKVIEGMALAKAVYQTLGCAGMARVDTFLDINGKFWFNEINPIPGHTKFSLYPLMCEANGLPLTDLIDRLVVLGLHRRRQLDRLEVTK